MVAALRLAVLPLLLSLPSPRAWAAAPEASAPAGPSLETSDGTIRTVDLAAHTLTVDGEAGAFTVALDRNTLVYLPRGLASVGDLRPGARIRVSRDGSRACWVEVNGQPGPAGPAMRGAQGTGPGGGAPPPADSTGPASGPPPPGVGPGSPPAAGTGAP